MTGLCLYLCMCHCVSLGLHFSYKVSNFKSFNTKDSFKNMSICCHFESLSVSFGLSAFPFLCYYFSSSPLQCCLISVILNMLKKVHFEVVNGYS